MRIAQVMLARGFGGAERSFVDLSRALAARGHEVLAIGERDGMALPKLAGIPHVTTVGVRCLGSWDPFTVRAIRHELANFRPDVVQAHLARAARLAGRAAHAQGLPTLAKTHNLVKTPYYKDIDLLVPTTQAQSTHLVNAGIEPARIRRIPNFSGLVPVAEPPLAHPGPPLLKTLGRFVAKKGFAVLLDAFAAVHAARPDARLVIGGDGPDAEALRQQARALGLADAVEFSGWIDDIATFLADASLFVLPSHDEPFGIVLLEAMARGVPIVTTPAVGPREILPADAAFFSDRDDVPALIAALEEALCDPRGAHARARRALQLFCEHYSEEVIVARYEALYRELTPRSHVGS